MRQTDERRALAAAIDAKAKAEVQVQGLRDNRSRALSMVDAAETRLTAAKDAVAAYRTARTSAMVDVAAGAAPVPTSGLREARLAEADADDELAASQAALAHHEAVLAEFGDPVAPASRACVEAAQRVIASEVDVDALINESRQLYDRLMFARTTLSHFLVAELLREEDARRAADFLVGIPSFVTRVSRGAGNRFDKYELEFSPERGHAPIVAAWQQTIQTLASDAKAASVPGRI